MMSPSFVISKAAVQYSAPRLVWSDGLHAYSRRLRPRRDGSVAFKMPPRAKTAMIAWGYEEKANEAPTVAVEITPAPLALQTPFADGEGTTGAGARIGGGAGAARPRPPDSTDATGGY